jgi:hypothetical protein
MIAARRRLGQWLGASNTYSIGCAVGVANSVVNERELFETDVMEMLSDQDPELRPLRQLAVLARQA